MTPVRVAIIGGGLAGLSAAARLAAVGITDWVMLEARDRLGGRILGVSVDGTAAAQVDLGPTWFWPSFQPELAALVDALGLVRFAQPGQGDGLVERAASLPPMRYPGGIGMADAFRLRGGMGALVDALPYLVDYPYGCTEQTLNRFLPTVLVQKTLKNMGVDLKAIRDKRTNLNAQEIGDDKERAAQWKRTNLPNPGLVDRDMPQLLRRARIDRHDRGAQIGLGQRASGTACQPARFPDESGDIGAGPPRHHRRDHRPSQEGGVAQTRRGVLSEQEPQNWQRSSTPA